MVEDKVGWMVSYLFGLESMAYLTTGLIDAGIEDYSVESAMAKVTGTEFVWYQANRAMQLKGGAGYMRDEPYELIMRDIRIFPIFEGANDVLRAFIALTGIKPLGEELSGLGELGLSDPIGSIGVLVDYVSGRIQREVRPGLAPERRQLLQHIGRRCNDVAPHLVGLDHIVDLAGGRPDDLDIGRLAGAGDGVGDSRRDQGLEEDRRRPCLAHDLDHPLETLRGRVVVRRSHTVRRRTFTGSILSASSCMTAYWFRIARMSRSRSLL